MKTFDQELPPGDRAEQPGTEHDAELRRQLMALRDSDGWSNGKVARKMGVSTAQISTYLNEEGCKHEGDTKGFERKAWELLTNEARRKSSGVETVPCDAAEEVLKALAYIKSTNDLGAIIAESGEGKTRGLELYRRENATCITIEVRMWQRNEVAVRRALFGAVDGGYDQQTPMMAWAVKRLLGSDRLVIVDDAHKLTMPAIQCLADFNDVTKCPVALVGTLQLHEKIKRDPQLFSRVGLGWPAITTGTEKMVKHLVKSMVPDCGEEFSALVGLSKQVAKQHGRYRSVHKELKLAVELHQTKPDKFPTYVEAFRGAHTLLVRNYALS